METRIITNVWKDARTAVLSALNDLHPGERGRLATAVIDALRAGGFLQQGIEYHYSATALAQLLGRSDEYVMRLIRARKLAPVMRDGRGWLIPTSTAQRWLDQHAFDFGKNTTSGPIDTGVT